MHAPQASLRMAQVWLTFTLRSLQILMRSHCLQFVFWWWAHATRRQGIFNAKEGEISFHYLCFSNRPFILGILEWNANAAYVIDFEKKPWCFLHFQQPPCVFTLSVRLFKMVRSTCVLRKIFITSARRPPVRARTTCCDW